MILAIDQGTTGTHCMVFDGEGRVCGRAYSEFEQHFPRPGWVEHDAAEIWDVTRRVARGALDDAGVEGSSLEAIGITNQRETVVAWDRDSGEPLHNALVWQDRRTAARCDELREAGHEQLFRDRTGLVIDPYFSGTKIEWLLREGGVPPDAAFGTIDSWLVHKLVGRHAPVAGIAGDQQAALYGRPVTRRERARTPTARAASCSRTPGRRRPRSSTEC